MNLLAIACEIRSIHVYMSCNSFDCGTCMGNERERERE
jgi:hypothetical protein